MLPARRRPPARTSSFLSFYVLEAVDPLPAAAARWKSSKLVFISTAALLLHLRRSRFLPAVPLAGCRQPTQTLLIVVVTGKATLYCVAWRSIQQSLSLYRGQMRHFQFRDQLLPLFSCLRNRSHRSKDQLRQRRVAAILSTFFEAVAILILGGRTAMMIDHGLEGAFLLLYLFTTYIDRHTLLTHSILIAYTTHYSTASIEDILNVTTSQCSLEFILI